MFLFPKPHILLVNKKRLEPLSFSFWIILFDVLQGLLFVLCVVRLQGCKLFDVCVFFSYGLLPSFFYCFFSLFLPLQIFFNFHFLSFPSFFLSSLLFLSSFMITIPLHLLFAPSSFIVLIFRHSLWCFTLLLHHALMFCFLFCYFQTLLLHFMTCCFVMPWCFVLHHTLLFHFTTCYKKFGFSYRMCLES